MYLGMSKSSATAPARAEGEIPSTVSSSELLHDSDLSLLDPPADLKSAYVELRSQYQRCAAALATAAHDLRTPLAVISGYVELLVSGKLGDLNEKQQRVMEDMQVSSTRLQRLVNDFLTFSSLETGAVNLRNQEPQDMNACLQELKRRRVLFPLQPKPGGVSFRLRSRSESRLEPFGECPEVHSDGWYRLAACRATALGAT
jgi:hypothetical protein